jgi:hypothetical protein
MFHIPTRFIKASLFTMAKKDVRFYLKGLHIECTQSGDVHLVSTDGACMMAGLIAAPDVCWVESSKLGPWRLTIPRDVVDTVTKTAARARASGVTLAALPDGRYMLGDVVFTPLDGSFPDWRRVCPTAQLMETWDESPAHLDIEILSRASDAVATWFDMGGKETPILHQHGTTAAVITGSDMTCFAVVMPRREQEASLKVRPFTPAHYETK